jgi:hypothetical protein
MENQKIVNVADQAHPKMSPRYKTVQTNLIAQKFKDLGFIVDGVHHRRSRTVQAGYGRHMVKLSHPELLKSTDHNDVKMQLIVTNSFDGSSAFKIQLGFFRFVCANGMIVGETLESYKHKHTGMILEELDESIERIAAQVKNLSGLLSKMKEKNLSTAQIISFEHEAMKLRSDKIQAVEWTARREEDKPLDLFTVYNRIQEDLVRGGTAATSSSGRVRVLREIKGVDKLRELNEKLFDLAVKYVEAA